MKKFIHLLYVPTLNCNMQCRYCYLGDDTVESICEYGALETLSYAVEKFGQADVMPFNISLHGGEVTTLGKQEFRDLIAYIDKFYEKNKDVLYYIPLRWELNKTPISQRIENYSNSEIDVNIRDVSYVKNVNESMTFKLIVSDEKVTKEQEVKVNFVYPYYYGSYTEDTLTENVILSNGQKIIDIKNNQEVDMSYKKSKIFFAYPFEYGELINIKDGNCLSYMDDFTVSQMRINSVNYMVYKLEDEATVSHISFSFIFEKEGIK